MLLALCHCDLGQLILIIFISEKLHLEGAYHWDILLGRFIGREVLGVNDLHGPSVVQLLMPHLWAFRVSSDYTCRLLHLIPAPSRSLLFYK
jgi:hypothetical protein